jgi:hypothetical protein
MLMALGEADEDGGELIWTVKMSSKANRLYRGTGHTRAVFRKSKGKWRRARK